jgi:vacuolar-type H+-ATPase subunit I/STV1
MDEIHALGFVFASEQSFRLYAKFGFMYNDGFKFKGRPIFCMMRVPPDCSSPADGLDKRLERYLKKIEPMPRPPQTEEQTRAATLAQLNSTIERLQKAEDKAKAEKETKAEKEAKAEKAWTVWSEKIARTINLLGEGKATAEVREEEGTRKVRVTGDLAYVTEKLRLLATRHPDAIGKSRGSRSAVWCSG